MKLVIDIPENQYTTLNAKTQDDIVDVIDHGALIKAIKNGTPLPKRHGDLIDRNDAIKSFRDSKKGFWRKKHFVNGEATMESMAYEINDIKNILNGAHAIIKADKGGEQE